MKKIIFLKKTFSILASISLAALAYYGADGHSYTLFEGLIVTIFPMSVYFLWNEKLFTMLSESNQVKVMDEYTFSYIVFELVGFLLVFANTILVCGKLFNIGIR